MAVTVPYLHIGHYQRNNSPIASYFGINTRKNWSVNIHKQKRFLCHNTGRRNSHCRFRFGQTKSLFGRKRQ